MISVVIPLYNKESSIRRTITSIINQTYQKFEIIVVNDGSKDRSLEIVQSMACMDKRIRLFNQENQGVSVARNRGVKEANFDYIAFMDGDDEWLSVYLDSVVSVINKYPNVGMICTAGLVTCDGNIFCRNVEKYKNKEVVIDYFQNPHIYTHTSATVVKKSIFMKTEGFPSGMRMNQDYACFFNIAMISDVVFNGRPLSVYHGNIVGQTTQIIGKSQIKIKFITERFNYCYKKWIENGKRNKNYLIFTKYEIRAIIINAIRKKEIYIINYLLENLDKDILDNFSILELKLYRKNYIFSQLYILITKCIWRLKGFPVLKLK